MKVTQRFSRIAKFTVPGKREMKHFVKESQTAREENNFIHYLGEDPYSDN